MQFRHRFALVIAAIALFLSHLHFPLPTTFNPAFLIIPAIGLIIMLPLMINELPVILDLVPRPILKLLCFVPSGAAGFWVVKLWLLQDYGIAAIATFLFLILLYGSFTLKDMLSR